ncbi:MAG TPA: hypothetical protein VM487_06520 [Phycisphaerae bacterium]|nr:hypothetical protein [Phycisphaerae bacterium]
MPVTYRIRNWDQQFENAGSRKVAKRLSWVAMPNSHDGAGYRRIMAERDGVTIYGCWCLIVQVASRCPERGLLLTPDGPIDAEDLAAKTGVPAKQFERAFEILENPKVKWLERIGENANSGSTLLAAGSTLLAAGKKCPTLQDTTLQDTTDRTGQDNTDTAAPPPEFPAPLQDDRFKAVWKDWLAYLKERRKNPSDITVKRQLKKLAAFGVEDAIASIEASITNGWQGLFDASSKAGSPVHIQAKEGKYARFAKPV